MSATPPGQRQRWCVIDANAIIRGIPLDRYVTQHRCALTTTPAVLREIRDSASRERLERLPFPVSARNPSDEAVALVVRFARLTGDIAALSKEDIGVIALAATLEAEAKGGIDSLRKEPPAQLVSQPKKGRERMIGEAPGKSADASPFGEETGGGADGETRGKKSEGGSVDAVVNGGGGNDGRGEVGEDGEDGDGGDDDGDSDSDSDSGGWITPSNIAKVTAGERTGAEGGANGENDPLGRDFASGVLTADFAMQNVILQMGLRVLSVDGLIIREVKRWVLRCHACFHVSTDNERKFCEKCGNQTLQRVESVLREDGTVHVFVRRRPPPQRGHKYSIPTPKGGRSGDIVLREDQYVEQMQKRGLMSRKPGARGKAGDKDDFMDADHLFFTRGGSGGGRDVEIGFGRRNPNVSRKRIGKKNKGRR